MRPWTYTVRIVKPVLTGALDPLVEAQLAQIFERILGPHQRARRYVEPVDQAREQEAQRGAAREQRQAGTLFARERTFRYIALQQRAALGDVVGMVRLEAPSVEAD